MSQDAPTVTISASEVDDVTLEATYDLSDSTSGYPPDGTSYPINFEVTVPSAFEDQSPNSVAVEAKGEDDTIYPCLAPTELPIPEPIPVTIMATSWPPEMTIKITLHYDPFAR